METPTNPRGPFDDSTAAAPRSVLLNRKILKNSGSSAADAKTTAAACTSSGIPFSISISIAAPPEASSFHYDLVAGEGSTPLSSNVDSIPDHKDSNDLHLQIIAAHNDSVLIESKVRRTRSGFGSNVLLEYFLYEAGNGAAGLAPTLSLLPGCYFSKQLQRDEDSRQVPTRRDEARNLSCFKDTGILRRGEGDVLVAELEVGYDVLAELCVLRLGHDWVLKQMPIVHHERKGKLRHRLVIDSTVPVGSRFMCWVDYRSGFVLCDMSEDNDPKLRYVLLPLSPSETASYQTSDRLEMQYCRNLAAAGPGAVRFVSVAPRCCCGGPGKTSCERSNFAFNVTTWTLTLRTKKPMAWFKDGVLDCNELWQLPNYDRRLPRVALRYPIVSSDDPDIVCFAVFEKHCLGTDETVWMVEINMRRKEVLSVVRSHLKYYNGSNLLTAKLHW